MFVQNKHSYNFVKSGIVNACISDSSKKASQQNLGRAVLKFLVPVHISYEILALMLCMSLSLLNHLVIKTRTHSPFGFVAW